MSIVNRVQNILTKPAAEWEVIANEPATVGSLFTGYAAILLLIPLVIGLLSALVLGAVVSSFAGAGIGAISTGALLVKQVIGYVLGLVVLYGMSHIVTAISPSFNGKRDLIQSAKLMVYSGTALWISYIGLIIPFLGVLVVLAGLGYSIYTIFLGLVPVLGVPKDKAAGFTVVIVLVYIVLAILVWLVSALLQGIASPVVY